MILKIILNTVLRYHKPVTRAVSGRYL